MMAERWWFGDAAPERIVRAALLPVSFMFGAVVRVRGALYDAGILRARRTSIPVVSVGNLTAGGTGKTPIAAALAARAVALGARPAIVLRGYGGDEGAVHALLNPAVPVTTGADRVRAVEEACSRGATIAILDDAFQHRRVARDLDIVIVSVEQWRRNRRLLPAGPGREPDSALARAGLVIVTRKIADPMASSAVAAELRSRYSPAPVVEAYLVPSALQRVPPAQGGSHAAHEESLSLLRGANILAIAGVGAPGAFFEQLAALGARVTARAFRDHHAYSAAEATGLARDGGSHKYVVTTAKDAVKLAPIWPAWGPPLWYVSQAIVWSDRAGAVDSAIRGVLGDSTTNHL